jgi:hypothetical protein
MGLKEISVLSGWNQLRIGSCKCGSEPSGSIKGKKFLDQLSDCPFFKKDCCVHVVILYQLLRVINFGKIVAVILEDQ